MSKEIGALADLVEANEAKGRMGQVRASCARLCAGTHKVLTGYSRWVRVYARACAAHA